jgi:hypothetical protein
MISGFFILFFTKPLSTFPSITRKATFQEKRFTLKILDTIPKLIGNSIHHQRLVSNVVVFSKDFNFGIESAKETNHFILLIHKVLKFRTRRTA